jgi:hypothetical protein
VRACDVIDAAVEILEEYRTAVSTARAAFMEGDEPYHVHGCAIERMFKLL